jgi:hypothetical protein
VPLNALRAPGYKDVDLGVFKTTDVWRGAKIQFRAEATNAFNMVSLSSPVVNLTAANFGAITSQQGSQRVIQLGARLTF